MYLLSKLFTYLILPPGIFIIALIFAGVWCKRFRWLFVTLGLMFYLLSIKPVANLLLEPLENIRYADSNASSVVVLGGGANTDAIIKAYPDAFKREFYGFYLAKEKGLPLIFSAGGVKQTKEANSAKSDFSLMQKLSNSKIAIYYEDKSLNTKQNAKFSAKLFDRLKLPKNIYLVTSAYHMKRAIIYFKKAGFKVTPKAVDFKVEKECNFYDYLPKMRNFANSYKAIHEYIGILVAKVSK